jgi:PAS domain S-box-containing protein
MTAPLTGALDPGMTADQVHLQLTGTAFDDFAVLQRLLRAVNDAARTDVIYGPAQPELVEFGEWVCGQVERQHAGAPPQPWTRQTPLDAPMTDHQELTQADRRHWDDRRDHVIVTDDASVILRVTAPVLEALGYARESDLLGRRIVAVVPERFHQAHVAGTALHATNGRSHLLGRPVVVPLVRASGEEVHARLCVEPTLLPNGRRVFVADVRTRDADARVRASHGSGPVLLDS